MKEVRKGGNGARRDWNPDRVWAETRGYSIRYSSARNAVLCPELNISSDRQMVMRDTGVGAERIIVPRAGAIPENYPANGHQQHRRDGSAARSITTAVQAEKKDDSGK